MLRQILEENGYAVVAEAENGLEAVTAYREYRPDIITLDITMPQMDGVEALKEIMKFDPDAYAIMITAAGQQQKVITALKAGAAKFVMKPFMKEEVLASFSK
jgi:DNA-binding NarL/FixJ family response regulator